MNQMREWLPIAAITAGAIAVASLLGFYLLRSPPIPVSLIANPPPISAPQAGASTPNFRAFLDALWADANTKGVSRATFERAFAGVTPDPDVLEANANQPEHARSTGDYVGLLVSDTRIANGREKRAAHDALLADVEAAYGVDRHVVLAIWGIESAYGASMGTRGVVRSLATLATGDARRGKFWRGELIAALSILERGDTTIDALIGSWAGAMGHTQFIPSTFLQHAVDFNRDGRRDIWETLGDALGSTANYLKASGWTTGRPWGFEVRLPQAFDFALADPTRSKNLTDWRALGLAPVGKLANDETFGVLQLIVPAGATGPAFLVTTNFRAILRYNNAVPYALSVGHLADRLADADPLSTPWPLGDKGLSRVEREEMQRLLTTRGHDAGQPDGILGTQSRSAIRAYQAASGVPPDGHPNGALLDRLRRENRP